MYKDRVTPSGAKEVQLGAPTLLRAARSAPYNLRKACFVAEDNNPTPASREKQLFQNKFK